MRDVYITILHDASVFHEEILIGVNTHINYEDSKFHFKHMVIKNQLLKQIASYEKNEETYPLAMKMKSNMADVLYCHKEGIIDFEEVHANKDSTNVQYDNKLVSIGYNLIRKEKVDIVFIATKFGVIKYNVNTIALENNLNFTTVSSQLEYRNKLDRFLAKLNDDYTKHHKIRVKIANEIKVREDMFKLPHE
ncbi:MAG: hypothetical protein JXR69_07055 [Candidatus Delongbacteria bacterium]|nr:hypothetical protein [Candidatus Delongbacteria bacterium]